MFCPEEEMHAAQQAHDAKLEHLSHGAERYARKQTESEFAGKLTAENAAIAMRLAKKAMKKKRKFLAGYEKWEEEREEAKVRAKYEKQRKLLLGESGHVKKVMKVMPKKAKPRIKVQAKAPLALDAFHQKLAAIRRSADHDIAGIHHDAMLASSLSFTTSGAVDGA